MRFIVLTLLACAFAGCVPGVLADTGKGTSVSPPPLIVGRMQSPSIDGRISASEWEHAGLVSSFVENSSGGRPQAGTRGYIGYDDQCLYVAVICEEPLMSRAVQTAFVGRDREVWTNECVELFLNPTGDRISYYQFIADILGQKFDALGADPYGYNPDWRTASVRGDNEWTVEIAVPFSSINTGTPAAGDMWYGLIGRERQGVRELSASHPTFGGFDAVGRYGAWIFASAKSYLARDNEKLKTTSRTWPAVVETEAAGWKKRLQAFESRVSAMSETGVLDSYSRLASDLQDLRKEASSLSTRATRVLAGGSPVLVTPACPYQPFTEDPAVTGSGPQPVDVTLLEDEWVDVAFNITNVSDAPITLRCTARQGEPGADYGVLGFKGLETLWQEAVAVAAGDGEKVFDAIVPIPAGTIVALPGRRTQVWFSIHAPIHASGNTEGRLVMEAVDGTEMDRVVIPVKVSVLPVQLTAKRYLECFTWDVLSFPPEQYPDLARAHYRDLRAHGVNMGMISSLRVLPRVKANPDGSIAEAMDFTKLDNLLFASRGMMEKYYVTLDIWETNWVRKDLFGLEWGDPAYERAFKNWWRAVLDHLHSRGLSNEDFVVNPVDESSDTNFVTLARWVKEVDPGVRTVIDSHGGEILRSTRKPADMADIWMPHYTQYFDAVYKQNVQIVRDAGMPLWVYYYSESGNEKRMDPTTRYLSRFWWAFGNDVTGMGYWAMQLYGDPWFRKGSPNSYDTSLVYPAANGVIPSRRWQAWRQGWQDYTLLSLAREKMRQSGDAAGLSQLNDLVRDTVANGVDPVKTAEVRSWLRLKAAGRE